MNKRQEEISANNNWCSSKRKTSLIRPALSAMLLAESEATDFRIVESPTPKSQIEGQPLRRAANRCRQTETMYERKRDS
jgi:hypothetical protein